MCFFPSLGRIYCESQMLCGVDYFPTAPQGSRAEVNFCLLSVCHCICFYCLTVQVQALFFSSNSYSALHNRQEEEFGFLDGCCCSKNCCISILGAARRGSAHQAMPVRSPPALTRRPGELHTPQGELVRCTTPSSSSLVLLHVFSPLTLNAAMLTQRGCPAAPLQIFKSWKEKPFLRTTERIGPLVSLHARLHWGVSEDSVWLPSSSSFTCRLFCTVS